MHRLFNLVEPLPTAELLANYWHFLRSIEDAERAALGPIEVVLKSRAVARGWPVALKNQTLALVSEPTMTEKCAMTFVDVTEVSSVSFFAAHLVLPFVTAGAVARSPLQQTLSIEEVKQKLVDICEDIRTTWETKILFETDPTSQPIDEMTNLFEVLLSVLKSIEAIRAQGDGSMWAELLECPAFHIVNSVEMKDIALTLRDSGEIELAFHFSRALPKNLDEKLALLFAGIF